MTKEQAKAEFEKLLEWVESDKDLMELVTQPHVHNLLAFIMYRYIMSGSSLTILSSGTMDALVLVAQASYMAGYKRGLETGKLEKLK